MRPIDSYIKTLLDDHARKIETVLRCDLLTYIGPILTGFEDYLRKAVEHFTAKKETLGVIIETQGGVVEVVERMVRIIRHHYNEVIFIVPNMALSAGTIFVLSGDRIIMEYYSCLGPIDPQIQREEQLIPALSYLEQFDRLNKKAKDDTLTTAEYALLSKLDLGDLYIFEQARDLSIELITEWLPRYKFKDWKIRETSGQPVTDDYKKERAKQIATILNNTKRWHSHGRGISKETLVGEEIKLKIEELDSIEGLAENVHKYFELATDYVVREKIPLFIHTREFF